MSNSSCTDTNVSSLTDKDFARLSSFIHSGYGIKMPEGKRVLLEARLRKRLRVLGMHSYTEYCDYLFSPEGAQNELVHMIDVITTNKTDFFREPKHFDYLVQTALPELDQDFTEHIAGESIRSGAPAVPQAKSRIHLPWY